MRSPAVKPANNALANHGSFGRVFGVDETFSQNGKLWPAKFSLGIELVDEADDARLLSGVKSLDLIDYLRRCHNRLLPRGNVARNLQGELRISEWSEWVERSGRCRTARVTES